MQRSDLTAWSSRDGLTWTKARGAFPLPSLGSDSMSITDVTASSGGWLAVGRRDPACFIDCGVNPKRSYVWLSEDGLRWTRVADQPGLKGGGMNAVARWRNGFVAAGGAGDHAAIWLSPDGRSWSRVADAPLFHGPTSGFGDLPAVAGEVAVVDGVLAVLGDVYAQDGCPPGLAARYCPGPRAWSSKDGDAWSRADMPKTRNGQLNALGIVHDGLLAVGFSQKCSGHAWSSADGLAWTCEAAGPPVDLGDLAVAGNDKLDLILGTTDAAPAGAEEPIWVSHAWYRPLQ
jgi:hypothetical protein